MTCEEAAGKLSAYSCGLLDGDEYRAVRQHLIACADCRKLVDELRQVDRLASGERLRGDEGLTARIMAKVREAEMARSLRRSLLIRTLWPVAALIVCGVLAMVSAPALVIMVTEHPQGLAISRLLSPTQQLLLGIGLLSVIAVIVVAVTDRLSRVLT